MKNGGDDRFGGAIEKLKPRLRKHALNCLLNYCMAPKPRLHKTAAVYVERAINELDPQKLEERASLTDELEALICALVTADEIRTREIIAATDWEKAAAAVYGFGFTMYGTTQIHNKDLKELVQDAVLQLLDRGRHFPHYRGVAVIPFLCKTLQSNIDHALRKAKREPRMLRIVTDRPADRAQGEVSEENLPAVDQDDGDDDDDDGHLRHPRLANPDLLPGLHRYGRGPSAYAHSAFG